MQRTTTTIKAAFLALILSTALPLAACDDDNDVTQPGPTVSTPTAPTPTPEPTPPTPEPTPTPTPPAPPTVTISGPVVNLNRGGTNDLDISFRIDDFTIVRAASGTPVTFGSQTFGTDAVRNGQQVTVTGTRTNGFLDATKIDIVSQAP